MTIPFLNLFKRKAAKEPPAAAVAVARPHVEKPSSERMSKTVLPNVSRVVGQEDSYHKGNGSNGASAPSAPRVAFSTNGGGGLPPAVALALEPKVERAISLDLADVVAQMPAGLTRPLQEGDANRRVLLKASEIEKGMTSAKPTVSIATVYQQVPEIFLQSVPASDTRQVPLPFDKVLEQFGKLQLRSDQYRDQTVPQLDTPFLTVTLEDNTRFGITNIEPIQTGELPPVRLEPATAESFAAAEPEATFQEKFVSAPPPIALTPRRTPAPSPAKAKAPAPSATPPAPARIPFKLTPNGTDVPSPERVPASSGPSVPTSSPAAPAPTRIPFKIGAPTEEPAAAKPEPWLTKESFDGESATAPAETAELAAPALPRPAGEPLISLALKPILQNLPPFQLTGDISGVPDDARLELPFSLVEPQLITGRVMLKPAEFAAALAQEYRGLFSAKEIEAPVALPLQDVLKNLPTASLRMREDQEEQEKGGNFATPFSAKAEEDAARFNSTAAAPIAPTPEPLPATPPPVLLAKPVEAKVPFVMAAPMPAPVIAPVPLTIVPSAAPAIVEAPGRTALQEILDTDDEVDAKTVVAHAGEMRGIKACAIMFADGLSLAGNLPPEFEADGLCAMAPSLLQRVENHLEETKLGALRAMTISCAEAAVTFFMQGNLCLAALHAEGELPADVRTQLSRIVDALSQKYSHPV